MKSIISLIAFLFVFHTISKAQLTRVNTTEFSESIISTFEQNNTIYTIYQKAIHANQYDMHLLSISPKGIQTNVLLLQDTINELYVLHAQFHANKFYIFYDAFALDGSKKAWFKLGIFDEIGKLLSSQTLDTTSMENLDTYIIDNTVVFSPVKGTHTTAFSINPNTYSITSQVKFLPLFSKGYTLMFDDKANNKMYYYFFKNTFQQNDEFLEIASLNLNDTSLVKWNLDVSKFNLNYDIDITHVRKTYGDTIAFSAETYTDTIVHETYILNYVVSSDKYASSILSKNCLDEPSQFIPYGNYHSGNSRFSYEIMNIGSPSFHLIHKIGFVNELNPSTCYKTFLTVDNNDFHADSILQKNIFSRRIGFNVRENISVHTSANNKERLLFVIQPGESQFRINYLKLNKSSLNTPALLLSQTNGDILILIQVQFEDTKPYLYTTSISLKSITSSLNSENKPKHNAYFHQDKIYLRGNTNIGRIQVSNIIGQMMLDETFSSTSIELSQLPTGIYIAHIQQGNSIQRLKFFKP